MAYKNATIQLDLAELDDFFEGYYVKIRNPRLVPWEKRREAVLEMTSKDYKKIIQATEDLVVYAVLEWNIEDIETGELLPVPSKDRTSLNKAPSEVTQYLMDKIAEVFIQAAEKKTKNSSAASTTVSSIPTQNTETLPNITNL